MAIRTRSVLAIGLALLAAACGIATSGPGAHAKATPSQTAALAMSATPDTDLTGGQPLPVRMTGFPPDSTTELYECVAAGACGAAAAATVLAYSSLLSTSWVSATQGWALAAQPCANGTCARLARTTDGGQHWQLLPDPTAGIQDGTTDCSAQVCVSRVSELANADRPSRRAGTQRFRPDRRLRRPRARRNVRQPRRADPGASGRLPLRCRRYLAAGS